MPTHRPSATRFVVCGGGPTFEKTREQLARLGQLNDAEGETLVIQLSEEPTSPRAGWERVQHAVGKGSLVAPVLIGERGTSLYPTGCILVRFDGSPSDAELEKFARTHGLRVGGRNRYKTSQASFEIAEPETTYLPDLTDTLSASPEVRLAWPETKTRYTRW